jgi:PAS domain S-box-containing protein
MPLEPSYDLEHAAFQVSTKSAKDPNLAEEALRECEDKYRMLLDEVRDYAIFMLDPQGVVVSWNAGAERIKGYRGEHIIGHNFSCFFPPEDIKQGRPEEVLRMATANGRHEYQGMRVRKDGSRFLASIIFIALRDQAGNLRGFSEISRDLSERKESGEKYRGLLEAAPDAIVVVNQGGAIVLLNVQAEKQFGYHRDELVGQKVKNIIPEGFAERLIADGLRSVEDALAQQIRTGIELIGRRKDGSDFPIEIMLSPLESAEGILVTAAVRDITERKRTDVTIREERDRAQQYLDIADVMLLALDSEGRITMINRKGCSTLGWEERELLTRDWFDTCLPARTRDALRTSFHSLLRGELSHMENPVLTKSGEERMIAFRNTILRNGSGHIVGTLSSGEDITERKKSEEHLVKTVAELKRSNDELQQFAYVASHDLQEPLRMVASYTQLLAQRYKGRLDSDADEFIAYAVDGSNRMQGLIKDLLTYSRAGANGKVLHEISSENALKDALTNLRATIEESSAVVTHDLLPAITMDETQLVQLFQNLVGNAIKYRSAEVPLVHVSASKNGGDEWIFSVRDNGLGIDPQYFERIFIIFQRLHGPEEFQGTGIGLAICKKMVECVGGRIWVESQPEKGSTFYFALPERNGK